MKGGEEEGEGPPISLSMKRQGILTAPNYSHLTECTVWVLHGRYLHIATILSFVFSHGGQYTVGGIGRVNTKYCARTLSYFCPVFGL